MTSYLRFSAVIIFLIGVLAGCATKEAVKTDTSKSSSATSFPAEMSAPKSTKESSSDNEAKVVVNQIEAKSDEAIENSQTGSENRLDSIYFDFDSYLLSTDARNTLSRNANWLRNNSGVSVLIEGHADERGSDEYNLALGEKRAGAARRYIETLGVKGERVKIISYGEEKPATAGHDEESWAKNRRAEFVVVK